MGVMHIGERIKNLRVARKISTERLGVSVGKNSKTISRWEAGKTTPRWEDIVAMAELFGIKPDQLTRGVGVAARKSA